MSLAVRLLLKRSSVVADHQGHIEVIMVVNTFLILIGARTGGKQIVQMRHHQASMHSEPHS